MRFITLLFIILIPQLLFSQSIDLDNWIEVKKGINKYKLPTNETSYIIAKDSSNYKIEKRTSFIEKGDTIPFTDEFIENKIGKNYGGRIIHKVFNGYLISYYNGEFGGSLYFISNNGEKYYQIQHMSRIKFFFEINNNLYAADGLSHLGGSRGSILKLHFKRKWRITYHEDLKADALDILKHNNNIYIVTRDNLLQFSPDATLKTILSFPFSIGIFYPTSSVIIKNDLYIAMRSGALQIKNFENKATFHWLEEKTL